MMTAMAPTDSWVDINEAASQLRVHPRTLRRYIKDGRLTVQRLSPQVVRIRPEDIDKFKDENILIRTGTGSCWVVDPKDREVSPLARKPTGMVTPF